MGQHETITLGGGCFWCLEAVYDRMEGVVSVESGYMGGHVENPAYKDVCGGRTGHVEVVQVTFDTATTNLHEILDVFFTIHDPTTRDRQGNDVGPQYRSVIFYHDEEQRAAAEQVIAELTAKKVFRDPIVTDVEPAAKFYVAEDYHQEYFENNPWQPYCMFVVSPKVDKFRSKFGDKLKAGA
ncbi:MAG: peptide-methionine (S)-S-oxide reductase MsrA [Bryobacteraceae bacterium]|nr:peptide-methionine (S)-S-oxide reductase MsrA [Bryobacteraceae bacterium]